MLAYGGLLLASFGAVYGYLALQDAGSASGEKVASSTTQQAAPAGIHQGADATAAQGQVSPITREVDAEALVDTDRVTSSVHEAVQQATSAPTATERDVALTRLGGMGRYADDRAMSEILQALAAAATGDTEARNRLRAIESVGRLARQLPDRSMATAILQRAALDPSAPVATRARQVLASLEVGPEG
jgi:hypothetical protein